MARFSSDIRKCLQVLASAIDIFTKAKKGLTGKIPLDVITQAHEKLYEDPIVKQLSCIPGLWKTVLIKVCCRIKNTGKACWYSELEQLMLPTFFKRYNLMYVTSRLQEMNIIKIKLSQRLKDNRVNKTIRISNSVAEPYIELNVELDQVINAFRNE